MPPPAMSLAARLLNVFAIPREVFEVVSAGRPSVGNWLLPMLLSGLILGLTGVALVSQPAIQKQMHEHLEDQVKALQAQAKAGKAQQAEVDRTVAMTRAVFAPPVLRVLTGAAFAMVGVARVFWWAMILWFVSRAFLKVQLNFFKTLEVAGLALMIAVLGGLVTLLLMVNLPKLFEATSLTAAVSDFDPVRQSPLLLAVANVFSFWFIGVLGVGLGRLAKVPFLRAAWFVLVVWLLQQSVLLLVGGAMGQLAL
jgi:Yip1 domain